MNLAQQRSLQCIKSSNTHIRGNVGARSTPIPRHQTSLRLNRSLITRAELPQLWKSTPQRSTSFMREDALLQIQSTLKQTVRHPALLSAAAALSAYLLTPTGAAQASEIIANLQAGASIPGLVGDDPLREGFISAFLLIFFSEIGDKTFFIAVLLALRQPKSYVFAGTFGALAVMSVISVGLGQFFHELDELVPNLGVPLDDLLAVVLLIFFGISTLLSAAGAEETAAEEREEAQEVVDEFSDSQAGTAAIAMIASTFVLVFAAEWGDKSFLATIALSAASSPAGVVFGAIAGHGVATVIAVLGGSFLGKYLSEKVVQYVGGSLFLVFAAATIYDIATGAH